MTVVHRMMTVVALAGAMLAMTVPSGSGVETDGKSPGAPNQPLVPPIVITPSIIDYPEHTRPTVPKSYWVQISNNSGGELANLSATCIEDSAKGPGAGPSGWMAVGHLPALIPISGTDSLELTLNNQGIIQVGPTVLWGKLRLKAGMPVDSVDLPIRFTVADTIVIPVWDTLSSSIVDLTVGTNGNMGQNGIGYVNLDFAGSPSECDTGLNSRGNAAIYLKDASPVIIRKPLPGVYRGSWSLYNENYTSSHGFKPMWGAGYAPHGEFTYYNYRGFHSGTFLTVDSMVKCEMTWYAPLHPDSGNFVIQRLRVFSASIGVPVTNLQIGLYYDFDLPSDSGDHFNVGGTDNTRRMARLRGFNSADGQLDCADNSRRYAGVELITWFTKNRACFDSIYSVKTVSVDDMTFPAGQLTPESLSATMHVAGYASDPRVVDHAVLMTIKDGANGYTLPANDTLTIFTSLCVVRDAATTAAGLDSVKLTADKSKRWTFTNLTVCTVCCWWKTGNVNQTGVVDLADLSALVSYLTGGGYILPCYGTANINAIGIVDLADLSFLVCYLTGGGCVLPFCPVAP